MCGIAGVIRFDGGQVDPALLRAMADRLAHRGPDGEGYFHRGAVGLAHRRLAIIDITGSPQPMSTPDERLHVCFNGEIFNYRELREEIAFPYRTDGDTEVLLAAYAADGADGVRRLRGQFAYALFDEAEQVVTLFRDRVGVLPLYYHSDGRRLVFASEVKALEPAMPGGLSVDTASLDDYLTRRAVAAPFTLFSGVRKLLPGHTLRVDTSGHVETRAYWTLPDPSDTVDLQPDEAVDAVGAALDAAVADALVADVPVGAYLSGGVDSSLIVATATRLRGGAPVETFAAGFGAPTDELHHARRVAEHVGSNHHEVTLRPGDFSSAWQELSWFRDAPLSEPADVAVWSLATEARKRVKVVLSGEGSDELFAGYPKHRYASLTERVGVLPARARTPLLRALERALPAGQRRLRTAVRALSGASAQQRAVEWFAPFTEYERRALLGPRDPERRARPYVGSSALDRMLRADCPGGWLADNLLERGDRMSMAASLELRPPFLDHRLVDLAFRLDPSLKLRGRTGKWVVKELARRHLPPEIVDRPKSGFVVPLHSWFRGDLRSESRDRLLAADSFVSEVMDRAVVRSMLDDHARGRRDETARLWTLMCLETWHGAFFRSSTRANSAATG